MGQTPLAAAAALISLAGVVAADTATIEAVRSSQVGDGWRFDVTIRHGDTGWDDYADGWRVELQDGTVLDTRVLFHPHVEEQPFTRSLSGVEVPQGVTEVFIRARTNVEGWGESVVGHRLER